MSNAAHLIMEQIATPDIFNPEDIPGATAADEHFFKIVKVYNSVDHPVGRHYSKAAVADFIDNGIKVTIQ